MALPTTGFSAVGIEEIEWGEFITAWSVRYMKELKDKPYHKDFNPKFTDVLNWAFAHRDIVWGTPFAEQEKMMIADGVLTESDIKEVA